MINLLNLAVYCLPAVLFLPVGYLLIGSIINPELDSNGRRLPRIVPGLMLATLLTLIAAWVMLGIMHFL